jgi:hypothetical protein
VARFGRYAEWLEVTSDRFDHTSELPADANAGNRFYGRDVAEFVSSGLSARAVDARVAEEDLGGGSCSPVDEETLRTLEATFEDAGIASRRVEDVE